MQEFDKIPKDKKDLMLEEYKAEMRRHNKAIHTIFKKYIPGYDDEIDRRQYNLIFEGANHFEENHKSTSKNSH